MSETPGESGLPAHEPQPDPAEYAAPAATCGACGRPVRDCYYEVGGRSVCQDCGEQLRERLTGGSAAGRFARAALYGTLAGAAGAALYYGVREATRIEFGLISVLVGLMVGKAVKKGSDARGGWFYQGLAVFLTYTAVMTTYIPPALKAVRDRVDKKAAAGQQPAANPAGAADAPGNAAPRPRPSPGRLLVLLAVLVAFAYAVPVIVGFHSPMAFVIIGIGLYEAWVLNRRVPLPVNGPYPLAPADAGGAVGLEPAG